MAFKLYNFKESLTKCPVCGVTTRTANLKLHIGRMASLENKGLYGHTKHKNYRQENLSEYNKRTKTLWTK